MSFKPMLSPNQKIDLSTIKYPIMASIKLDGIRCVFKDGQMLSRSLKPIPSKHLQEKFTALKNLSEATGAILDGEIYSHELTFQEITSWCMTIDRTAKTSVKKYGEFKGVPSTLMFHCFDCIEDDDYARPFIERCSSVVEFQGGFSSLMTFVPQMDATSEQRIHDGFKEALKDGYEGLILKDPNGKYKCGRATLNEGLMYKVKPFEDFDAKVIGVVERMENTSESYTNELGRSQKHRCQEDMKPTGIASALVVDYNGENLKVSLTGSEDFRREIWENRDSYVDTWCNYKAMMVGSKDLPRHPVFLRFREDK